MVNRLNKISVRKQESRQRTSLVTDLTQQKSTYCFPATSDHPFLYSSRVERCGWVELPSDSSFNEMSSDPFFLPYPNVICKFKFSLNKFFPLLHMTVLGLPLGTLNRMMAFRQISLFNLGTTSIFTVLIVRHVNRQHHRISFIRPILTLKVPM